MLFFATWPFFFFCQADKLGKHLRGFFCVCCVLLKDAVIFLTPNKSFMGDDDLYMNGR